MPKIDLQNIDCMQLMAQYPDKYFDLAICDPEYGIGASEMTMGSGKKKEYTKGKKWDTQPPAKEYFEEVFRVSKNQIIWGANYFTDKLPVSKSWIFWDKCLNKDISFADGELAWTSFDRVLKKANIQYSGFLGADKSRIHITQKPIRLYEWILRNYAKEGDLIFDPNFGSASSAIAAHNLAFNYVGCEIDAEYFEAAKKRFDIHSSQLLITL